MFLDPKTEMLYNIIYFSGALLVLLMGIITYLQNKKSGLNRMFAIFTFFIFIWTVSLYFIYVAAESSYKITLFLSRFTWATAWITGLSYLGFVYKFLFPKKNIVNKATVPIIIFSVFSALLTAFTGLFEKDIYIDLPIVGDELGPLYPVFIMWAIIGLAFSTKAIVVALINSIGLKQRRILMALFMPMIVLCVMTMLGSFLPLIGNYSFQRNAPAILFIYVIIQYYSIQKTRFLNISRVLMNILRRFILLSLFLLVATASFLSLDFIFENIAREMLGAMASLFAVYISSIISKKFPEFKTPNQRLFEGIALSLKKSSLHIAKYKTLAEILENYFVVKAGISKAEVLFIQKGNEYEKYPHLSYDNVIKSIRKRDIIFIKEEILLNDKKTKKQKNILKMMDKLSAAVVCPIFTEKYLSAILVLGEKEGSAFYTKDEIKALLTISEVLEVIVSNILVKDSILDENNLMKQIIREKTNELKSQVNHIQTLVKQQADFIALTAHEFRTPLSIALFQLEDTLDSHKHSPEVMEEMEVLSNSLKNLKSLTQNLFDVQQMDLNLTKPEIKKTNIAKFIKDLCGEFLFITSQKNIKFNFPTKIKEEILAFDPMLIRQVLINVLTNAIKYGIAENAIINLSVKSMKTRFLIEISDNGPGIPRKHQNKIFDKFHTKGVGRAKGMGLGLYFSKKIMSLHKGDLRYEDNKPKGAKFIIEFKK